MESKILGEGGRLVQFSCFMYVTYCHLASSDIYGLFKIVFDCLWVVVDVFKVVVGDC